MFENKNSLIYALVYALVHAFQYKYKGVLNQPI